MAQSFSNNGKTTVAVGISPGDTSIDIASAASFPTSGNYTLRINNEYLLVTGGQGTTTWTVLRGQEGSSPGTHNVADEVIQEFTLAGLVSLGDGFWPSLKAGGDSDTLGVGQWRGGMGSGHPPSGVLGDWVLDEAGNLWYCTSSGTPGAWARLKPEGSNNAARAYLNAGSHALNLQPIPFDTIDFDPGSNFNLTTHRYTAPVAGLYDVTAAYEVALPGTAELQRIDIVVNAVSVRIRQMNVGAIRPAGANPSSSVEVSGVLQLALNDVVRIDALFLGGTPNLSVGRAVTWVEIAPR